MNTLNVTHFFISITTIATLLTISLGNFIPVNATNTNTVNVNGMVWDDTNHNTKHNNEKKGIPNLQLAILDASSKPVLDPNNPTTPIFATTDSNGNYHFKNLLPLKSKEETYTIFLLSTPEGYISTTGLTASGKGFLRPTNIDLTTPGTNNANIDFALAKNDSNPIDPNNPGDDSNKNWLVMPNTHSDVLYPEINTNNGSQSLKLKAHTNGYQPTDWNNLVIWHTDQAQETLPKNYTPTADYSFIGKENSTVYRSRLEGAIPNGSPWIGASTQSPTLNALPPDHPFSFRLDAVTNYDGGKPPGEVILWSGGVNSTNGAPTTGQTIFSTIKGLPEAWSFGKGKHAHFNWTFTQPGIYCMAFSVQTEMPNGSRQKDFGILTQIVGSQYEPQTIEPCGRHLSYPQQSNKPVKTETNKPPIISGDRNAVFAVTTNKNNQKLHATYNQESKYGNETSTSHSIDDIILYGKANINYPYRFGQGERGARSLTWDTTQINNSELNGDITWSIDDIKGPGELLVKANGEWNNQKFDTANGIQKQTLWAESKRKSLYWEVTRPGKYCVKMTWSAQTNTGQNITDHHTLTLVAEGPLNPNEHERNNSKMWKAAENGALKNTCAQGGSPTDPNEVLNPDDNDNSNTENPNQWKVPNWSKTDSGALILNDGHIDIASTLNSETLNTQIKDTTNEGQTKATHDGAAWHDPNNTVLQLLPDSKTKVPDNENYRFLGTSGKPVWIVNETQQSDLLWPGWSTETIPTTATQTGISWNLNNISGPGEFALYKGGQTLSNVDVLYNTRNGITSTNNSFEIAKNSHAHGSWAFSAEGTYCLAFTRSTTLTNGKQVSNDFTLTIAVGKVDVKKINPNNCFNETDKPDHQDTTPIPESELNDANSGNVQILDAHTGFYPGQLVTVQVGDSAATQWVSTWLHSNPTWLGWEKVKETGITQLRLPTNATLGEHKIVVKKQTGELIGWDTLVVEKNPNIKTPNNPINGKETNAMSNPNICTTGKMSIISSGHLDYSTQIVNGKLKSLIGDSSSGSETFKEPSNTILWLKPSSKVTLPAGYEQIGAAGSQVFMVPQTQNMNLIWLGWSTEKLNSSKVSSPVTWTLSNIDGPGTVKVFLNGEFGGIQSLVFDGVSSYDIKIGVHAHANWAFSAPGIYRLHLTQSSTLADGTHSSNNEVLTIAVGDIDPSTAIPGGKDCVENNVGGSLGTSNKAIENSFAQFPPNKNIAQCKPSKTKVISNGHLDWNAQIVDGKLVSSIGDDSTGTRVYQNPATTILWLKPESKVTLPFGFTQIGIPGSTIWQVPQAQNHDLIWLGWSTELLNASNASSDLTWSLTNIEGPGTVKVYTTGSFGAVENLVFNGTGSSTINLGVHAHANWAFSQQGTYRLHFNQTVTLPNGERSSDSKVLTVAVGDVNPNTVLDKSLGCDTSAILSEDNSLEEAPQVYPQFAGTNSLLPIETFTPKSPIRFLLNILGSLLLFGGVGSGMLWWWRTRIGENTFMQGHVGS